VAMISVIATKIYHFNSPKLWGLINLHIESVGVNYY